MEIAAAIGGALLAPAFESLVNKLASQDLLNYARKRHVLTEINKSKEMLESIYGVLEDAEEKQMVISSVKTWVSQLRNLAYDLEDILDEFDFEARRSKLKAKPVTGSSRVRKLFPNIRAVKFNKEMISKIKEISSRLEKINSQRNQLDLRERPGRSSERIPATCLRRSLYIYSWTGSIGKTTPTLAQLIFDEAGKKFDLTAWVSVGEDFDVVRLTKTVLESVRGDSTSNDLNSLQLNLKAKLSEKKFFMVLDDVWNENYDHWTIFLRPFENGAKESRIIVTTRNLGVSRTMGAIQSYTQHLGVLENDDCLLREFDEDEFVLHEDELVLQWMAEGFVQHAQEMKQMKRSGHLYFHDLLWRSFFQQSTGNKSRYVMHDLLNDLAKSVGGEICLHLDDDELKGIKSHANVRHSAFTCHRYERYQRFEDFYEMSNLRTFLALWTDQWRLNFLSIRVVHDLVPQTETFKGASLARYQS
ncbi:putative disease resistance RPP13-like protein 1 [Jatropha curcas]|uniref:putative disease resistance RPP13-like protein 1 n=1 Tax=Jatropha curcas TaxID=180498 RepID=UPI0018943637|nr:putative disease resistance RPP13-like protein 1 [Jatropha curcas]